MKHCVDSVIKKRTTNKRVCVFKKEQFIKMYGKKTGSGSLFEPFFEQSKKSQHFALQREKLSDNKF